MQDDKGIMMTSSTIFVKYCVLRHCPLQGQPLEKRTLTLLIVTVVAVTSLCAFIFAFGAVAFTASVDDVDDSSRSSSSEAQTELMPPVGFRTVSHQKLQ